MVEHAAVGNTLQNTYNVTTDHIAVHMILFKLEWLYSLVS